MVPKRFQAFCELCGDPIDTRKSGVHQWEEGWVENRHGGGGHAIRCVVKHLRWACKLCVDKRASAAAKYQPTLFG